MTTELKLTLNEKVILLVALTIKLDNIEKMIEIYKDKEDDFLFNMYIKEKENISILKDKIENYSAPFKL
jgi:hypothetical protein